MSFEVTVTPTVYNVEVEVNPSVQPFDVQVITQQDLADLVDEAKQYAEDAEDSADSASASASSASASASASASSANSASASASSASGSASTATTQAGIATTQAGIATTQAGIATTKAQEASQSASDALASEQASAQSASDALQSEQNALASEQASAQSEANALASEQSASASASTATAQAGIATTQAGIATTQAGNALTSANNALNSANAAAASAASASAVGTSTLLTGFATGANTTILGTDTILGAFQKAQGQINARVSGTGTSGQVAFWSGTGSQTGDSGLTWDNTNKNLKLTRTSAGVLTSPLTLVNFNDSVSTSVSIRFAPTNANPDLRYSEISAINNGSNGISLVFTTGDGPTITEKWRITNAGILQSNGAQTIRTSTGLLSFQNLGGNVAIGTTTDAGFRLDVNGSTRFNGLSTIQGTTASDSGQLGDELLTTGTGDASWTGSSFATGYTHVAGSTTTLTSTLAGVVNNFYQITYTVTNRTAGSFTVAFGGQSFAGLTATGAVGPRATTTGSLVITPTSDFNGTIVLSIRVISPSSASVTFTSSGGTVTNQIRISSSNINTFFGREAGRNNTTGSSNSFIGANAGQNNTTGNNNSFVGVQAGQNNTTGFNNSFVGANAGRENTTGSSNSFVGRDAGLNNTTGNSNSFVGVVAGFNNTTGGNNSFIGANAGQNNTTGNNNSFVGVVAGFNNTTGGNNTSSGVNSLGNNTTGGSNTAIGSSAGRFLANGSTALTIANNSVFLGADTRANADNETNQIVIGHTAIGLGSNTTVIGNSSTTFGRWWGNLLIGTSTNQASSVLTMESTTRGFLPPRMTSTERNAIATPATGLVVYNTTDNRLSVYNGTAWVNLATV
jgi:hypothetical protein